MIIVGFVATCTTVIFGLGFILGGGKVRPFWDKHLSRGKV